MSRNNPLQREQYVQMQPDWTMRTFTILWGINDVRDAKSAASQPSPGIFVSSDSGHKEMNVVWQNNYEPNKESV